MASYISSCSDGRNEARISIYPAVPCIVCYGILYDRIGRTLFGVRFPNRLGSDSGRALDFQSSEQIKGPKDRIPSGSFKRTAGKALQSVDTDSAKFREAL